MQYTPIFPAMFYKAQEYCWIRQEIPVSISKKLYGYVRFLGKNINKGLSEILLQGKV